MSISKMFSMLRATHTQTQLLEACNWDEERAEEVVRLVESTSSKILAQESQPMSASEVREKIVAELSGLMTSQEIITIRDILNREVLLLQNSGDKYEN